MQKESFLRDTTTKEKIVIIAIMPFVYGYVGYVIIRAIFDKEKREEWASAPYQLEKEILNPKPDEDASDEEWDAYYRAEDAELEKWDRQHRVGNFFLNAFFNVVLLPIMAIGEWIDRIKNRRTVD